MKHRVLSLAPLPADTVRLLIEQTPGVPEFEVVDGYGMNEAQIRQAMDGADAVLADYSFRRKITSEMISTARNLKLIQQPGAIDLDACFMKGIKVANTVSTDEVSVAEHTIACALCLLKNLLYAHAGTRLGEWPQMEIKPAELKGKVWGLIGLGHIGRAVAHRVKPFEPGRIVYHDLYRLTPLAEQDLGVEFLGLKDLLHESDIVSLHVPLTRVSRNMIDSRAIARMKRSAYLINVSGAALVDEEALARAIRDGSIAGAAVDVFSEEPVPADHPLMNVESDRMILSPHVAGISDRADGGIIAQAAANIARVLKGEEPEHLIT